MMSFESADILTSLSAEFLEKYTIQPFTKDQKLPVVILKLNDDEIKQCQFVKEEGCSIYEDRPWSCRMYPIGLASQKTKVDDPGNEFFLCKQMISVRVIPQNKNGASRSGCKIKASSLMNIIVVSFVK